ncbi:phosphatase PAP2 family protein [Sphingomonas sp. GC_Shp_6]|nr:phosphatase PAP2 family protein [Sphingomonas sp. GC_Shp_6]
MTRGERATGVDGLRGRAVLSMGGGVAIGAAAVAALLIVGRWLVTGVAMGVDTAILAGIRRADAGGRWLGVVTDVTALGSGPVLTLLVAIVAGWLLARRHWRDAILLAAASASAGQAVNIVKAIVARTRPEVVPHWVLVGNYSYPSAHSADSAAVASLVALLAMRAQPPGAGRTYVAVAAVLLVGLIGFSRVYLAVHWPTDVLAGWSFGTAWALGWWRALGARE